MDNLKTVEGVLPADPLYQKQQEDVARMRTSLLSCKGDPTLARNAIQSITVMRVYHQMTRIIRYTELMNKLEDKLYESIDRTIDKLDAENQSTWMMLLNIQERLQKSMIESQKLLQPYLDMQDSPFMELAASLDDATVTTTSTISFNATTREKLRVSAQGMLKELDAMKG